MLTPVLILSGDSEVDSKVRSFGFGADDYVIKPFHREELVARIHAVVRRSLSGNNILILWQRPCFEAVLLRHLEGKTANRPPDTPEAVKALEKNGPATKSP